MASRGKSETEILEKNLFSQLDRLIDQLKDIEEAKNDMSVEEYEENKNETLEQLKELNVSLSKIKEGNLSLINDLNSMQLAIQAAISQAFQTPEVIQMFAKKQQPELRQRLAEIDQSLKLGKIKDVQNGVMQKVEILCALQKLGETLTDEEQKFVSENISNNMKQFEKASTDIGSGVLNLAGSKIQEAKK